MLYTIWTVGIEATALAEKYAGIATLERQVEAEVVNSNAGRYEGATRWLANVSDITAFTCVVDLDDFVVAIEPHDISAEDPTD